MKHKKSHLRNSLYKIFLSVLLLPLGLFATVLITNATVGTKSTKKLDSSLVGSNSTSGLVNVYVGYADTLHPISYGPPSPWETTPCKSGSTIGSKSCPTVPYHGYQVYADSGFVSGVSSKLDNGAIMIINPTNSSETVSSLVVTIGTYSHSFVNTDILPADTGVMLDASTSVFDTSDEPSPSIPCNQPDGLIPQISFSIQIGSNTPITYTGSDSGQVLNTGGVDRALCPIGSETENWSKLSVKPISNTISNTLTYGGCNANSKGSKNLQDPTSQNVNTENGNLIQNYNGFSMNTLGGPLGFNLTYNSLEAQSQIQSSTFPQYFGVGWNASNMSSLDISETYTNSTSSTLGTTVTATCGGGAEVTFSAASNTGTCPNPSQNGYQPDSYSGDPVATFCAYPFVTSTLSYNPNPNCLCYVLRQNSGLKVLTYNNSGQLEWIGNAQDPYLINVNFNVSPGSSGCPTTASYSWLAGCIVYTDSSGINVVYGMGSELFGAMGPVEAVWDSSGTLSSDMWSLNYTFETNSIGVFYPVLTSITDPIGNTDTYTYSTANSGNDGFEILSHTTPKGGTSTTCGTKTAPSYVICYGYNSSGQVISVTDPMGNVTNYSYSIDSNGDGNSIITSPNGDETEDIYSYGELTQVLNGYNTSSQSTTNYTYDPNTLMKIETVNPDGTAVTNDYDLKGNLCWSANGNYPNDVSTEFESSSCSNLQISPPNGATVYTYNHFGEPISVTDPRGNTTYTGYNSFGNVIGTLNSIPNSSNSSPFNMTSLSAYGCLPNSTSTCFVGESNASNNLGSIFVTTNSGSSFAQVPGTINSNSSQIIYPTISKVTSISCVSSTMCFATTTSASDSLSSVFESNGPILIEINYDSTTNSWSYIPEIQANGSFNISQLNSIDCIVSSSICYAVGQSNNGTGAIVEYSSSGFTNLTVPANTIDLNSISCSSSTNCVAVGIGGTNSIDPIDVFSTTASTSGSWTEQDQSGVSQLNSLSSISCVSSTQCNAVGSNTSGNSDIIQLNWSSTNSNYAATSAMSYIPLITSELPLSSISCTAASSCVTVGNLVNGGVYSLYSTNGILSNWSIGCSNTTNGCSNTISAPMNTLNTVVCSGSATCVAVGSSIVSTGEYLSTTDGTSYTTTLPISDYSQNSYYNSSNGGCYPIAGTTDCSSNMDGQLASSTDNNGNTTTYTYIQSGNLRSSTDPFGNETTYTYDSMGNLTSADKPLGNLPGATWQNYTTFSAYNADNQLCWTASDENSSFTIFNTCSSPPANATIYTYDANGNLILTQEPSNGSYSPYVSSAYNSNDQMCWTITASTNFSTDSCSSPPSGATQFTYDAIGNRISETGPNSNTSNWTYSDPNCPTNPTARVLPDYVTNSYDVYQYNSSCQLLASVNPLGNISTYGYDSFGNLVGQFPNDPAGVVNVNAIDCYLSTSCVAGGTGVKGHSTTMVTTTNSGVYINGVSYSNTVASSISSISCPSTTICYATGVDNNNNPAIYYSTNSGSAWTEQSLPSGISSLTSISCSSTTNCVAVGTGSSAIDPIDVYTTNGSSWILQDQSGVSQLESLNSIDCLNTSTCIAAGADTSLQPNILEFTWSSSNGSWSAQEVQNFTSSSATPFEGPISSISCSSTTNCVAVGNLTNSGVYVLYSNNVGTSNFNSYCNNSSDGCTYSLSSNFNSLNSLDCVSSTNCYATGTTTVSSTQSLYTNSAPAILNMNLSSTPSFITQNIPLNTDPETNNIDISINNNIDSISCVSSTTCYVGGQSDAGAAAIYETTNSGVNWNLVSGLTPETFSYDPNSNQTYAKDYSGITTTTYNNLNQVTSTTDGSSRTINYSYDNNGNITCVAYPMGYTSSNCNNPSGSSNTIVKYTYNQDNNMTSVTDWLNNTTNFTYSQDSQVTSVIYPSTTTYSLSLSYDPTGALINETLDNNGTYSTVNTNRSNLNESISSVQVNSGTTQSATYNGANQLTSGGNQSPHGTDSYYNYNVTGGNLNCITNPNTSGYNCSNLNSSYSNSLIYGSNANTLGSELGCSVPSSTILTSCPTTPVTNETTYSYSNSGQRLSQSNTTSTGTNTTYYAYDSSGNLNCITNPNTSGYNCGNQNSQYSSNFIYNYIGERMAQTLANSSSQLFIWNNNSSVPRIINDSINSYIYGPNIFNYGSTPIEQINNSTNSVYYLVDSYAGVTVTYNSSFSAVEIQVYSPYGIDTIGGQHITPLGYQSGYEDGSGLVYFIHREYDPTTGEFLTIDPMFDTTYSAYSYVNGDPMNGNDVSGLCISLFNVVCLGSGSVSSTVSFRFDPGAGVNAAVNIGRGASLGLSDKIANLISPGASCMVAGNRVDQFIGVAAFTVATLGGGSAADAGEADQMTGFTQHGLEQALVRDGGIGVSDSAISDAVVNPDQVIEQSDGRTMYIGKDATVVLNSDGKVITTWANNSAGWRNTP